MSVRRVFEASNFMLGVNCLFAKIDDEEEGETPTKTAFSFHCRQKLCNTKPFGRLLAKAAHNERRERAPK
jgi:hypothetical protein